jgi:hypothetical protein
MRYDNPAFIRLKASKSQSLKVSKPQSLKASKSQSLKVSKPQSLKVSKTHGRARRPQRRDDEGLRVRV